MSDVELFCREMHRRLDRLRERMRRPRRWPSSRLVVAAPLFSVWIRRKFRPYYRWVKRDGSLLEFGVLGLTVLVSLPPRRAKP